MQMALSLPQDVTGGSGDFFSCVSSDVEIFCKCYTVIRKFLKKAGSLFFLLDNVVKHLSPTSWKNSY